ncbi:MAG TPA: TIGR01777 family oxidoreductase [Terriglobales bacterium]|nr:TIGR01777 family oxidoreductase [Terriglobales bacterium]
MKILASGMSGTIGLELLPALAAKGHEITRLKTGAVSGEHQIAWDPLRPVDPAQVSGFDAVVHLAGENIFGRWTAKKKTAIRDSRVLGTRNLAEALAGAEKKPEVLISASAIGFYGSRGDEVLTEESSAGTGFLAEVARDWEAATQVAAAARIRVVNLRIGVVLSAKVGALAKMLTPFRFGVGGKLGNGRQGMSWIAVQDAVGAIEHILNGHSFIGQFNLTAPNPVSNAEFTKTLGQVLRRPTVASVPALALRIALGREMAEETVLSSQRVLPKRLLESGYQFKYPKLEAALRAILGQG